MKVNKKRTKISEYYTNRLLFNLKLSRIQITLFRLKINYNVQCPRSPTQLVDIHYLVVDICYLVVDIYYLVVDIYYLVVDIYYLVVYIYYLVVDIYYLVVDIYYLVVDIYYLVSSPQWMSTSPLLHYITNEHNDLN